MYLNSGRFLIVLLEVGRSFVRHSVIYMYILSTGPAFFLVKVSEGDISMAHIKEWKEFFQEGDSEVKV